MINTAPILSGPNARPTYHDISLAIVLSLCIFIAGDCAIIPKMAYRTESPSSSCKEGHRRQAAFWRVPSQPQPLHVKFLSSLFSAFSNLKGIENPCFFGGLPCHFYRKKKKKTRKDRVLPSLLDCTDFARKPCYPEH